MALSKSCLALFANETVPLLEQRTNSLTLGFPQIDSTAEELSRQFGVLIAAPSFKATLEALGFKKNLVLDVSDYEGADIVADLNRPLPRMPFRKTRQFDLVVDNGTLEHCFDIGQAFFNAKHLCRVGGVIFHNNPANWMGHGFWNMSPCVYFDFYRANGFDVRVFLRDVPSGTYSEIQYNPKLTTILKDRRYIIHAIARKRVECPDTIPIQQHCDIIHAGVATPKLRQVKRPMLERIRREIRRFARRLDAVRYSG